MHRIDTPTSENGKFVNGNANQGIKGTQVDSSWLNSVQEEICYVIEQRGGTLNKENTHQLYGAISALISSYPKKVIIEKSANIAVSETTQYTIVSEFDYEQYDLTIVVNNKSSNTGTFSVKIIEPIDNSVVKSVDFPMSTVAIMTKRICFKNDVANHPYVKLVVKVEGAANLSYTINGYNSNF